MVDRVRVETPVGAAPETFLDTLAELVAQLPPYDRISVGFPGVVRNGTVLVAPPNLKNTEWAGFKLAAALADKLGKPVKVINDAEMQGLAVIKGHGVEMVITFGTGFPSYRQTRMFDGLRSRWMMPFWWACCTAWQTGMNSSSRCRVVSWCSSQ